MGFCMKVGKWWITVGNHPSFAAWSWYGRKSNHLFSWQWCQSNARTFPSQCPGTELFSSKKTSWAKRLMKTWLAASNTPSVRCVPYLQRWRTLWDWPNRRGLDMQGSCVWLMIFPRQPSELRIAEIWHSISQFPQMKRCAMNHGIQCWESCGTERLALTVKVTNTSKRCGFWSKKHLPCRASSAVSHWLVEFIRSLRTGTSFDITQQWTIYNEDVLQHFTLKLIYLILTPILFLILTVNDTHEPWSVHRY